MVVGCYNWAAVAALTKKIELRNYFAWVMIVYTLVVAVAATRTVDCYNLAVAAATKKIVNHYNYFEHSQAAHNLAAVHNFVVATVMTMVADYRNLAVRCNLAADYYSFVIDLIVNCNLAVRCNLADTVHFVIVVGCCNLAADIAATLVAVRSPCQK